MLPSSRLDPVEPDRLPMIRSARSAIKPIASIITRTLMALTASTLTVIATSLHQRVDALVLMTVRQNGNNLEVSTSGSLRIPDNAIPILISLEPDQQYSYIDPNASFLLIGTSSNPTFSEWSLPLKADSGNPSANFGTIDPASAVLGTTTPSTEKTIFGLDALAEQTKIYTSTTCLASALCSLENSLTTFSLGESLSATLIPGRYIWTFEGEGDINDRTIQLDVLPVPGPLPLFGAGAAFAWSRRLRQRVRSSQGQSSRIESPSS